MQCRASKEPLPPQKHTENGGSNERGGAKTCQQPYPGFGLKKGGVGGAVRGEKKERNQPSPIRGNDSLERARDSEQSAIKGKCEGTSPDISPLGTRVNMLLLLEQVWASAYQPPHLPSHLQ